jgi:hypothetical protein
MSTLIKLPNTQLDFQNKKSIRRTMNPNWGKGGKLKLPRPSRAFGNEIITGDDEFGDTKNTFFFESGNGSWACHSLNSAFESFVKLLRKNHFFFVTEIFGRKL